MSDVKIEAFLANPPGPNDRSLSALIHEIRRELGDRVDIVVFHEQNELFTEYNLTATPAVVIGELVKIMGFCPSKETLVSATHEAGLE